MGGADGLAVCPVRALPARADDKTVRATVITANLQHAVGDQKKSGRAWVIGVCAPAVVTGIYHQDENVYRDVTTPQMLYQKNSLDSGGRIQIE